MEISQPKHVKERDVIFRIEESISLGLSIYCCKIYPSNTYTEERKYPSKNLPLQLSLGYSSVRYSAYIVLPSVEIITRDLMESSTPSQEIQTASENAAQSQLAETFFIFLKKDMLQNCQKMEKTQPLK